MATSEWSGVLDVTVGLVVQLEEPQAQLALSTEGGAFIVHTIYECKPI